MPSTVMLPSQAQQDYGRYNPHTGYERSKTLQIIMERYDITLLDLVQQRLDASFAAAAANTPKVAPSRSSSTSTSTVAQAVRAPTPSIFISQLELMHILQSMLSVLVHLSKHGFCHRDIKVLIYSISNQFIHLIPFTQSAVYLT
jgi:serine/threonine protein kinase